jgi:hypothetical protein
MFSVAVSLFNIEKMEYDWQPFLENFLEFGDELSINLNASEDNTFQLIYDWIAKTVDKQPQKTVRIVETDFAHPDPNVYGKCKNSAVQNATHQFVIPIDVDEWPLVSQRRLWEILALEYIQKDKCDAIIFPSINLWGSKEKAKNIGQKWHLLRQGLQLGVVNFARNKDGTHDINKSDGTEPLINKEGELARSLTLVDPRLSDYEKLLMIKNNKLPYVFHFGDVDFNKRIKRNLGFWLNDWKTQSGREEIPNVATEIKQLEEVQAFEHGLEGL